MRFYSSSSAAIGEHKVWLDGLVLLSTILFGFLLIYFLADVLPNTEPTAMMSNALGAIRGVLARATGPAS
jgi:hypothetical protein